LNVKQQGYKEVLQKYNLKGDIILVGDSANDRKAFEEMIRTINVNTFVQTKFMKDVETLETQKKQAEKEAQTAKDAESRLRAQLTVSQLTVSTLEREKQEKESKIRELQNQVTSLAARSGGGGGGRKGGCLSILNSVETKIGRKLIGDLQYSDEIKTPRGFSKILYLKEYQDLFECVWIGNCNLTTDHLVYSEKGLVPAKQLSQDFNTQQVRSVIVEGDSFYCGGVLVSSQTHFPWITKFCPLIDLLSPSCISLLDHYLVSPLEYYFG